MKPKAWETRWTAPEGSFDALVRAKAKARAQRRALIAKIWQQMHQTRNPRTRTTLAAWRRVAGSRVHPAN